MRVRGVTLIELVMTIIIIGVLVAFLAPILTESVTAYDTVSRNLEVLTKMRYAMERMAREIRAVRREAVNSANYDILTMTGSTLEFCRPDGTRVIIAYASPNLSIGYGANCATAPTTQILSDMVTSFVLSYLRSDGGPAAGKNDVAYVGISMTLTGTGTGGYSSDMRVDMRNP